jgi:hypothetical protein
MRANALVSLPVDPPVSTIVLPSATVLLALTDTGLFETAFSGREIETLFERKLSFSRS